MKRQVFVKFIKTGTEKKELKTLRLSEKCRIPNIGERFHYVNGFTLDFRSLGKVVDISTTYFPYETSEDQEEITIIVDISK